MSELAAGCDRATVPKVAGTVTGWMQHSARHPGNIHLPGDTAARGVRNALRGAATPDAQAANPASMAERSAW